MHGVQRGEELRHRLEAEPGDEARRTEHPQRIVGEGHLRLQRRAEDPRREVGGAVERVDETRLRQRQRHGVDREVAARQIDLDVFREGHLGLAAVGAVHVAPERRDLEPGAVLRGADRPEALALEPHCVGPRTDDLLDLAGPGVGGEIHIGAGVDPIEEGVPHGPADQVALVAASDEALSELPGGSARLEEALQARRHRHLPAILAARPSVPGMGSRTLRPGSGVRSNESEEVCVDASDWLWVWVGAALAFAVVEMVIPYMFFALSFTVGALVAALLALVDVGTGFQWGGFVIATAVALAVLVPIGLRITHAEGDDTPEGAARRVGRVAVVLEEIPAGTNATGTVRLERAEWRAETPGDVPIPAGTEVEVLSVRGTRLVVAPLHAPRLESGS